MPDWPEGFITQTVATPHGEFAVRRGGQGPAVWCLHGFPDTLDTWPEVAGAIAAAGYTVHALQMPGYGPACLQHDYRLTALADTVVMVMESLSPGARLRLIGHDWGAAVACVIANQRPELVAQQVMAAVPHISRFLQPNVAQLRRSWYMGYFQLPLLPERHIRRDDFAFIERLWRDWSPGWAFGEADIAPVRRALAQPGVLRGALAYYRALPGGVLRTLLPGRGAEQARCRVPTLAVAGEDDGCIGPEMFSGQEKYFAGAYRFRALPQAGHFMHREQPARFVSEVLDFFA